MKERVFSVSGWGLKLGAGVCALFAILVAAPNDVFADDPSCYDQCPMCAIGPTSVECQTCIQQCMTATVNCADCRCEGVNGDCSLDMCYNVPGCNTGCKCVPGMGSSCVCEKR